MGFVTTVLGDVPEEALGVVLPHEHIFLNIMRESRADGLLNDPELMAQELQHFAQAGGSTIVDCTSIGLGRQPLMVRALAERTGLHIVAGTGFYRHPYLDRDWFDRSSVSSVADVIIRDLTVGMDGTDVKAGIIGEVGCDQYITPAEERSFRAAARAHLATGVPITTHASRWPIGLEQLDILAAEGADVSRVIVGHSDSVLEAGYQVAIAQRAWVQFDNIRKSSEYDLERRVRLVLEIRAAGLLDRLLLSQDVCLRSELRALGGGGYTFVLTDFVERLRAAGLASEEIHMLTVDNPRRALAHD